MCGDNQHDPINGQNDAGALSELAIEFVDEQAALSGKGRGGGQFWMCEGGLNHDQAGIVPKGGGAVRGETHAAG